MRISARVSEKSPKQQRRLDDDLSACLFQNNFVAARDALARGADPNSESKIGLSAVMVAASRGAWEVLEDMAKAGADFDAMSGFAEMRGWTPMMAAARGGHAEAIREMIRLGADPDGRGREGWTPLMAAASEGRAEAAIALLEGGASLELSRLGTIGETALSLARSMRHDAFAEAIKRFDSARREQEKLGRKIGENSPKKASVPRGM